MFFEEFAEVYIGRAAVIVTGAGLRGVITVHDLLAGLTAGYTARYFQCVRELNGLVWAEPIPAGVNAKKLADRIAEFVRGPLRVVVGGFVAIADRDALDVGFVEEVQHDSQTLGAYADEGHVDFLARRDVARAAQDVAGNNG